MKTVQDIRHTFIDFFENNGHTHVPSAPLVPQNDPTLMFVNSGMVPFKNLFTGAEKRDYKRATSAQKSVRAGGKHNDLENVGYTARHHTFFEMLGNFSFGDYFKEEAISYAWELVSKNFQLPMDRLLVTVHSTDEGAADLWKKIAGFDDNKIIRIDSDDNFWRMGDTGPCGPCTEIFYDQGEGVQGGPPGSPGEDGDRFLEFWNLVFMQYEQIDADTRKDLPKPSIDTGMGLERMAAILQGKVSNYDTDLMRSIIAHCADLTNVDADGDQAASHRVIADHLRAASFLMADGVMPSNEGRGYVLRRIMRRGMRHAHLLGAQDPLMHQLFPTLLNQMGDAYPELRSASSLITNNLEAEEKRFKTTLDRGLKMLADEISSMSGKTLDGAIAFKLYDTFGFPLDLTQDALKEKGLSVDVAGFNAAMEEQKKVARASWSGAGGDAATDALWFDILDHNAPTEFLGYDSLQAKGQVIAIVKDGAQVDVLKAGEQGIVVFNQTPFYAESGGQVGDIGVFVDPDDMVSKTAQVSNVTKAAGALFLHHVIAHSDIKEGQAIAMQVDGKNRAAICANHSATHLLHEALRETLGDHVAQKGSLQDANRTRFDVSHGQGLSREDIHTIEHAINAQIVANSPVSTHVMPIDEARDSGAMALFGEKYDEEVRVVSMGTARDGKYDKRRQYSVELCGGTHVKNTGEIGCLKIVSDSALSAGVRRIEALTGERALNYMNDKAALVDHAKQVLKTSDAELIGKIETVVSERKALEKEVADLRRKLATGGARQGGSDDLETVNGVAFIGKAIDGLPAKDLKPMVDDFKGKIGSGVIVLISANDGKASIVVGVTDDLTAQYSAVDMVRIGSEALGGKGGGGRPDMAQAGGSEPRNADDAIAKIRALI